MSLFVSGDVILPGGAGSYYTTAQADALFLNKNGTLASMGQQDFQAGIKANVIDESDPAAPTVISNSGDDVTVQSGGGDLSLYGENNVGIQSNTADIVVNSAVDLQLLADNDILNTAQNNISEHAIQDVIVNAGSDVRITAFTDIVEDAGNELSLQGATGAPTTTLPDKTVYN